MTYDLTKRHMIIGASLGVALSAVGTFARAAAALDPQALIRREALIAGLHAMAIRNDASLPNRRVLAVADFGRHSRETRLGIVNLQTGVVSAFRCSHGRGSDPEHTGMLQAFSSVEGSLATPEGAFRIGELYVGEHGRSKRLHGLDDHNANAFQRAIVFHSAAYAADSVVEAHGKLGRSHGCFVVGPKYLEAALAALEEGSLLVSFK